MFKGSAPLNFKMAFGRISYVTQEVGACSKGRFQTLVMHPFTWLQLIPNCPCTKLERKDGKDPFINGMCEEIVGRHIRMPNLKPILGNPFLLATLYSRKLSDLKNIDFQ